MIADSHCHLDFPNLFDQLDNIVNRAKSNNVENLLTICTTLDSFDKIKLIVNKYKNIHGTFGIHPHESKKYEFVNSKFICDKIKKNNKIIGVGETGLDFYYNHSDKKIQKKLFLEHIYAASELKVPIIVHTRNAEKDTFEIIKSEFQNLQTKFLIHCFTGSKEFAKKLIDLNCYISVSGIITFSKTGELRDAVSSIPLNNLLVETDSPYLAPVPFRGKANEPSYIVHTIDKLSEIKNVSKDEIISYTTNNFRKLFKLANK
tara:strand:- start:9853 stop:10632 length:780 start_codon:yes stop_codon:yes gene_type:complete